MDIVIIGAGPAGMTAALYALRGGKRVLLLEKESIGGQMAASALVENLPMCENQSGLSLADKMFEKISAMGAEFEPDRALSIERIPEGIAVRGESCDYACKAVILATGVRHRTLDIPGEAEYAGRGVSYCAVCDGAFYKNETVAVIGGGQSAVQAALTLSDLCRKVYVLYRKERFTKADRCSVDALMQRKNVEIRFNTHVTALQGDGEKMTALVTDRGLLPVDGLFIAAGLVPQNGDFAAVGLDGEGYIAADESCLTAAEGVFAAGDCRSKDVRQIATAVSDGAVAALQAIRYIETH